MRKITLFFFVAFIALLISFNLIAQNSDFGIGSKSGITANYGITQSELNWLSSKAPSQDKEIPAELLQALENARQNGNTQESERILEIINTRYRTGIKNIQSDYNPSGQPMPEPIIGEFFQNNEFDWLPGDVLVAADSGGGNQFPRTLDLKLGDDGKLYLASIVSTPTRRRINVYSSTNGGLNWIFQGGLTASTSAYFTSLSMLVENKSISTDDSLRVIVYYTFATSSVNDDASVRMFHFRPNTSNADYVLKTLEVPTNGREFNYVSAVSDGQYYSSLTYFGCVVGEYSNNGDTTISHKVFRTTNWGDTHTGVTLNTFSGTWNDIFPVASFKASVSGGDSIYIATERDFSPTQSLIRILITPWTLSTNFKTNFVTAGTTVLYRKPVIAIKQSPRSVDKRIMITCTKDGEAKYHNSLNSGDFWDTDLFLDNRANPSTNTQYTYLSSDSTGISGDFVAMFSRRFNGVASNDSINIRRGVPGSMGTTLYQENSMGITSTHPAVTAIYRDGSTLRSTFAYWANGPDNIYFDGEHLISDVKDIPGTVEEYNLAQNYPNPFNPNTTIRFSIPVRTNVMLKIFNSIGQEVASLINAELSAGNHEIDFNATKLSSGVYFYRIETPAFTSTKKMILMK